MNRSNPKETPNILEKESKQDNDKGNLIYI